MTDITHDKLKQLLDYDPVTGEFFWAIKKRRMLPGKLAGSINNLGYRQIMIDYKGYYAHRLAWLFMYGSWPDVQLDHINGNRSDNRIANLRESTQAENTQNRGVSSNNRSGFTGVRWHSSSRKWIAQINVRRKSFILGYFTDIEDAIAARVKGKASLHVFQPKERDDEYEQSI